MKLPNFTFEGGHKKMTTNFNFSFSMNLELERRLIHLKFKNIASWNYRDEVKKNTNSLYSSNVFATITLVLSLTPF